MNVIVVTEITCCYISSKAIIWDYVLDNVNCRVGMKNPFSTNLIGKVEEKRKGKKEDLVN